MDTIHRVEAYCRSKGYDLIGIGIPKTVDNDLFGTDHTPGFASAARSNIMNVLQGGILARDMQKVDKFVVTADYWQRRRMACWQQLQWLPGARKMPASDLYAGI